MALRRGEMSSLPLRGRGGVLIWNSNRIATLTGSGELESGLWGPPCASGSNVCISAGSCGIPLGVTLRWRRDETVE